MYFPGSPILVVEGTFAEAVMLETLALSVLNYDTAVASAAARMVSAASGRPLAEMGSRRASERAAVGAARAAYIAGFDATSNLEAGRSWGIPTMGTAAHSFTLLHDSEEEAFRAQVDALGAGNDAAGRHLRRDRRRRPGGARWPERSSARCASTAATCRSRCAAVRAQLDSLGAVNTKITVTNDLDEFTIAALRAAPVDSYGVGTSVVTGSGSPAAGMVYKLVAHVRMPRAHWHSGRQEVRRRRSRIGGRKYPVRTLNDAGIATAEVIHVGEPDGRHRTATARSWCR